MSKERTTGGISFLGLLTIVFIILKLTDNATVGKWSWWAVLSPLWIPIALTLGIMIIWGALMVIFGTYK